MTFFFFFSIACFLVLSLILCLVVLIQEGKGGGLGASLGGGGDASDSLFGTSTPEILKKFTAGLAVVFVAFCLMLSFWTGSLARHKVSEYALEAQQEEIQP